MLSLQRERPLQRPAVSRKILPQHRGCACEGTVNQGGTTEVCYTPVLDERLAQSQGREFFHAFVQGVRGLCRIAAVHIISK